MGALLLIAVASQPAAATGLTQTVAFSASALGSQVVPSGWAAAQFLTLPPSVGALQSVTVRWDFDITSDSTGLDGFDVFSIYTRAQGPLRINGGAYADAFAAELYAGGQGYTTPPPCPECSCPRPLPGEPSAYPGPCEGWFFGKRTTEHVTRSTTFNSASGSVWLDAFGGLGTVQLSWDAPLTSGGNTVASGIAGTVSLDYVYATAVPEPESAWLMAVGLACAARRRAGKQRRGQPSVHLGA
jgi:hypothetical protein